MIWNTVLIWLIGMGILAGITFSAFLVFRDTLALVLVPIVLSVFVLPVTGAVCGFRAAKGQADITAALLIGIVAGLFLLYGLTDSFHVWTGKAFLCLVPVLTTGIGFVPGRLLQAAKLLSPVLYGWTLAVTILISAVSLYFLGVFQSQMAYMALPKELFYNQPKNSITALHEQDGTAGNHLLFYDETPMPFNGKTASCSERLALDFFTKKAGGVGYYIDGFLFGNSGDVTLPWYDSSRHGTGGYFNERLSDEQAAAG